MPCCAYTCRACVLCVCLPCVPCMRVRCDGHSGTVESATRKAPAAGEMCERATMVKRVGHFEANPKIKVPAIRAGASRNREALRERQDDEHLASTVASTVDFEQEKRGSNRIDRVLIKVSISHCHRFMCHNSHNRPRRRQTGVRSGILNRLDRYVFYVAALTPCFIYFGSYVALKALFQHVDGLHMCAYVCELCLAISMMK